MTSSGRPAQPRWPAAVAAGPMSPPVAVAIPGAGSLAAVGRLPPPGVGGSPRCEVELTRRLRAVILAAILLLGLVTRFYRPGDLAFYYDHNWEQLNNAMAWIDLGRFVVRTLPDLGAAHRTVTLGEIRSGWEATGSVDLARFGEAQYTPVTKANWPVHILLNAAAVAVLGPGLASLGLLTALGSWLLIPACYLLGAAFAEGPANCWTRLLPSPGEEVSICGHTPLRSAPPLADADIVEQAVLLVESCFVVAVTGMADVKAEVAAFEEVAGTSAFKVSLSVPEQTGS